MLLHEAISFPGIVIRCKALAALKVTQNVGCNETPSALMWSSRERAAVSLPRVGL
jgi:hypothetical protein